MTENFETERLWVRLPRSDDALRVAELMSEKQLPWNLARAPWPYTVDDAENWIVRARTSFDEKTDFPFVVGTQEDGLIGACGVVPIKDDIFELGYWIGKPYWGRGYVTEAARGVLDWAGRTLEIHKFISGHIKENAASGRVLIKLGFEPVGDTMHYVVSRDCEVCATRYVLGAPADLALESAAHYKRPNT